MKSDLRSLLETANMNIESCDPIEAKSMLDQNEAVFVDVRNPCEIELEGKIPGAIEISRGMLEFAIDTGGPYHEPIFFAGNRLVFYCKSGGRSALASQRAAEMGVQNIINLDGGFLAWTKSKYPTVSS